MSFSINERRALVGLPPVTKDGKPITWEVPIVRGCGCCMIDPPVLTPGRHPGAWPGRTIIRFKGKCYELTALGDETATLVEITPEEADRIEAAEEAGEKKLREEGRY